MAFDKKYSSYGVLKIKPGMGVMLYYNSQNYDYLYHQDIVAAQWSGDGSIIVTFKDGKRRRYTNFQSYESV